MNTKFEAIYSLISLLVKKAGFDIDKNYSESELKKTENSLKELNSKKSEETDEELDKTITNLKIRQANWQNNAEIVGKSLLDAYKEGKAYDSVKMRIELLANLANKGTDKLHVGLLYSRLKELENDYNLLDEKIKNNKYLNNDEKEIDVKYKDYLDNKVKSLTSELNTLNKELDELRDVETKDVNIVNKIKEYIDNLEYDKVRLEKALTNTINTDISLDIWEKIEKAKLEIENKLVRSKEILSKTEDMLEDVRENRKNLNNRKDNVSIEKDRCSTKLKNVTSKLEENNYENTTEKIMDMNSLEKIRVELDELNNKKEVLYVDASKVKEELIKEWTSKVDEIKVKEEPVEKEIKEEIEEPKEEIVIKEEIIEEKKETKKEIKKDKIVLDW